MYEIIAYTNYGEEQIESEITTRKEARTLLAEYRLGWSGMGIPLVMRHQRPTRFYVKPSGGACFEPSDVSPLVATIGKNVRKARQFGWTNQPDVCTFSGYSEAARAVADALDEAGFMAVVLEKDWR